MATNITREAVENFQDELAGGVGGLPPGYIEGFRPVLLSNLTVEVGGGVTSVQGTAVYMKEQILTRQMWHAPYTGGAEGFYYYVYLTVKGEYKVDFTKPEFSGSHYYYAHPVFGWRVILRLWIDSDDEIKFVSQNFRDTQRTVTVAPDEYVGEADYYCDGEHDEIWIKAAIEYADRVELLTGTFEIASAITITKENWEMFGSGAIIKSTAAITLGDGTLINNITLRSLRVQGMPSYKSLFVGNTVNSLVVDGCTFEMNTGFTATSCHFLSVHDCFFKGIKDYIGGSVSLTTCSYLAFADNSFRYYGTISQYSAAALICNGCDGSILNNTFFNSGSILLDSDSEVAFTISGNDHQDPVLFHDEGDATDGPGVAYGANTEAETDVWTQETVTFDHPYDSSIASYSAYKHHSAAADVYLSDDAGGVLGYGGESAGKVVASVYHDTGATPANTTLKFQGEVLGAWSQTGNDLNIATVGNPALAKLSATRVAFIDDTNRDLRTYDFDGADWAQVGNDKVIANGTRHSITGLSATRIALSDNTNDKLSTYDFDGTDWALVGNELGVGGAFKGVTTLSSSRIAFVMPNILRAYDFDGTDWTLVGNQFSLPGAMNGEQITALSSTRVALSEFGIGTLRTYDFDGTDWSQVGEPVEIDATSLSGLSALSSGRVSYVDSDDELRIYEFNGSTWSAVGMDLAIATAGQAALVALSTTRIAYIDATNDDLRTYDLAVTWTDIDTEAATANDEWEELTLDVSTDADTYDGYRVLVDSSEEYYCFRATALLDGYANVLGSCLRIPSDADVFLNAYENNSWQRPDAAVETRVTQRTKTLTALDAGLTYGDPTQWPVTFTMDDPANTKGLRFHIVNRHYGYGLMLYGDCEADEPILTGDSTNDLSNATFAISADQAHGGDKSAKVTKTIAAGTAAFAYLHDSGADLHGLTASQTYTIVAWMYVPTTGGPSAITEANMTVYDTTNSADLGTKGPDAYDEWQRVSVTFTIPASCSAIDLYFSFATASADTEYFYVDDVQCFRHYDVTVSGPIENVTSITLSSEGDSATIESDGDKYLLVAYHDHGQNTNGYWERDGTELRCRDRASYTVAVSTAYGSLFRSAAQSALTYPVGFAALPNLRMTLEQGPVTSWLMVGATGSVTATPANWYVVKGTSTGSSAGYVMSYYAVGPWR